MDSTPYKIVQTIYVDAGFSRLLDLISGYLCKLRWYVGDDPEDSLSRKTALQRWEDTKQEGKVALVLYPTRSFYSITGSGILLRVLHLRRFIQEKAQSISSIPNEIRLGLDHLPNTVEIEVHNLWRVDGDNFATLLAHHLTDHGCQVCMKSISGELLWIEKNT